MNEQPRQPVPRLPDGTLDIKCVFAVPEFIEVPTSILYFCSYGGECYKILGEYCPHEFRKKRPVRYP